MKYPARFPSWGLYCLTDVALAGGLSHYEQARLCLEGAAGIIQLRHKSADRAGLLDEARAIAALCRDQGAVFIVNDDPELALAAGADGVHLGQDDASPEEARRLLGPDALIGLSTHTRRQVRDARRRPVDYIGFGPVFPTGTKRQKYRARGVAELAWAVEHSAWPVVPIGGICQRDLPLLIAAGARHAAVISAVIGAPDIPAAARDMADFLARFVTR